MAEPLPGSVGSRGAAEDPHHHHRHHHGEAAAPLSHAPLAPRRAAGPLLAGRWSRAQARSVSSPGGGRGRCGMRDAAGPRCRGRGCGRRCAGVSGFHLPISLPTKPAVLAGGAFPPRALRADG